MSTSSPDALAEHIIAEFAAQITTADRDTVLIMEGTIYRALAECCLARHLAHGTLGVEAPKQFISACVLAWNEANAAHARKGLH